MDKTRDFAIQKFARELLEVRDNLQLAQDNANVDAVTALTDIEEIRKKYKDLALGLEMTTKTMDSVLKRFGVEKVEPQGEKFDPNRHEALFMM